MLMSEGPTAGHAESNACGDTSRAVRRAAQEPAEGDAIHRATSAGILSVHGEEDVKQHLGNIWDGQNCLSHLFFLYGRGRSVREDWLGKKRRGPKETGQTAQTFHLPLRTLMAARTEQPGWVFIKGLRACKFVRTSLR